VLLLHVGRSNFCHGYRQPASIHPEKSKDSCMNEQRDGSFKSLDGIMSQIVDFLNMFLNHRMGIQSKINDDGFHHRD